MPSDPYSPAEAAQRGGRYRGDSLLLLLDLALSSRVLVVGEEMAFWRNAFRNETFLPSLPIRQPRRFDLVLVHSATAATGGGLVATIELLNAMLAAEGAMVFFADNPFSYKMAGNLKRGKLAGVLKKPAVGYRGYCKALAATGRIIRSYLPIPDPHSPEEIWACGGKIEIPPSWPLLLRIAVSLGCFRAIASGYLFVAAPVPLEEGKVVRAISNAIRASTGTGDRDYRIDRFDLRPRGATVMLLSGKVTARRVVARIVSDETVGKIVDRNHAFLHFLKDLPASAAIKRFLPCPIDTLHHAGSVIYLETLVEGVPAWKVVSDRFRDRTFKDAVHFIMMLNEVTKQWTLLDSDGIRQLLQEDSRRFHDCDVIEGVLKQEMLEVTKKLEEMLHQKELFLVASHGDYGHGNILVDPASGRLRGVIDWDTGRKYDLPGVDLFNLSYQRERVQTHCSLIEAFKRTAHGYLASKPQGIPESYLDDLGIKGELYRAVACLAFVREVSRTCQYPDLLLPMQDEYRRIYRFLQEVVPL